MKTIPRSKAGFSLAEILVAVTISAFVLTSAYAAIISLAKGSESMINYSEMNGQTRRALEIFGRDARMANEVTVFGLHDFTMIREVWDSSANKYVDRFISYNFVENAGTFTRTEHTVVVSANGNKSKNVLIDRKILLFDVDDLNLYYYRLVDPDISGYDPVAKTVLEVKHVQLEAKLQRSVLNLTNTNYIISARFMMRNRDVGE